MGWVLAVAAAALLLWFLWIMARHAFGPNVMTNVKTEYVDLIEGSSIVEQQKMGRERWRRVNVYLPTRELFFEEQLALDTIQEAKNPNVRITTRPEPMQNPDEATG